MKTMKYMSIFFIRSSSHDKQHVFSMTLEKVFFEKKPWISSVVHLHLCSYDEKKKLKSSERKGIESIEYSMDSNIEEKHEEEHEDSKKERNVKTTN
jgi:hypothetical protein